MAAKAKDDHGSDHILQNSAEESRLRLPQESELDDSLQGLNLGTEPFRETIARTLVSIRMTLDQRNMDDLEELLTWCIAGFRWFDVEELTAVLEYKNKDSPSVLLKEYIQENYFDLLTVECKEDIVQFLPSIVLPERGKLETDPITTGPKPPNNFEFYLWQKFERQASVDES